MKQRRPSPPDKKQGRASSTSPQTVFRGMQTTSRVQGTADAPPPMGALTHASVGVEVGPGDETQLDTSEAEPVERPDHVGWMQRIDDPSLWVEDRLEEQVDDALPTLDALARAATRSGLPEPHETFPEAAEAAASTLDEEALTTLVAEAMNEAPFARGRPFGAGIDVRASLKDWTVDPDPLRLEPRWIRIPVDAPISRLSRITLRVEGQVLRDAWRGNHEEARAEVTALLQAVAERPEVGQAIAEAVDAEAVGPYDAGALHTVGAEAITAILQPHLADAVRLDASAAEFTSRWSRPTDDSTDGSAQIEGEGSVLGTSAGGKGPSLAEQLGALHAKLPDADLSELLVQAEDRGGLVTAGTNPGETGGDRRALMLHDGSPEAFGGARTVAAICAAAGYEIELVEVGGETPNAASLDQIAASLGFLAGLVPGDRAVVYAHAGFGLWFQQVMAEVRARGVHGTVLGEKRRDGAAEGVLRASGATASGLPRVPAEGSDDRTILREIAIANALAANLPQVTATAVQEDGLGERLRGCGLEESRIWQPGEPLSGQWGRIAGLREDHEAAAARVHAELVRFIAQLRLEARSATGGPGALAVTTAGDATQKVPDDHSFTQQAMGREGPLDQAFAETAADDRNLLESQTVDARGQQASGARRALVVGNTLPSPRLEGAPRDARNVAARRQSEGFEVDLRLDQTGRALGDGLREFFGTAGAGDRADFTFAGHGIASGIQGQDGRLVPYATLAGEAARARARGAEVSTTLDTCYAGAVTDEITGALSGRDELPLLTPEPGEPEICDRILDVAHQLRDLYRVATGDEGTLDPQAWAWCLEQLDDLGLETTDLRKASGSSLPLVEVSHTYAELQRALREMRAWGAQQAWLEG